MINMKLKKGDKIQVLTGKDKGKLGTITNVLDGGEKIVADGINMSYKHQRPKKEGEKGAKIQFAAPIHASNVMLVCPKCNKATRVNYKKIESGKKMRSCKKCQATF